MKSLSGELFGGILILGAMVILGLSDNLFYLVESHMGLGQFHAVRSFLSFAVLVPGAYLLGMKLMPKNWRSVMGRTIFQTISMFLYFGSLPIMTVAEAAAGLFTSPIFVLIFTSVIYREAIGWRRISAVAIGTLGVIFVLQPGSDGFRFIQLMPVAAGAFYAMAAMVTRRWCADEPPLALVSMFLLVIGSTGTIAAISFNITPVSADLMALSPFLFRGWAELDWAIWGWMFLQAVMTLVAIAMMTRGYQIADTSYVAIFEYSLLIFASLWTFLLWGQSLNLSSWIGFAMIASAGIVISRAMPTTQESS